jgi:hypothetical protein
MRKRKTRRSKRDTKQNERTLHIKPGTKVTFPVPAKHPFAKFQKMTRVRSTEDLHDFLAQWSRVAQAKDQSPPTAKSVVAWFAKARVQILRLSPSAIRIGKGAVVTLNNPLNHLQADTIEIAGDLVSRGDLILDCATLSIK